MSFILGGAASGKSAYAEDLARRHPGARSYIATAEAYDAEMAERIARHRVARAGDGWRTVEAPTDLSEAVQRIPEGDLVLIDCLTLWLSNRMLAGAWHLDEATPVLEALARRSGPAILVSNEVGMCVVPDTALGRAFRDAQGALNARIAARADLVVAVIAGLPLALKGDPS